MARAGPARQSRRCGPGRTRSIKSEPHGRRGRGSVVAVLAHTNGRITVIPLSRGCSPPPFKAPRSLGDRGIMVNICLRETFPLMPLHLQLDFWPDSGSRTPICAPPT